MDTPLPPFQSLIDAHGSAVFRLLNATVGPHDADDCYQETLISALRAYPTLNRADNLRGWLLTIAHRKAIDHLRRGQRTPVPMGDALPEAAAPDPRTQPDSPWPLVRELPPKQRLAVALRFALDLDYDGVGEAMGTSAEAARRSVYEGLKKLREEYPR